MFDFFEFWLYVYKNLPYTTPNYENNEGNFVRVFKANLNECCNILKKRKKKSETIKLLLFQLKINSKCIFYNNHLPQRNKKTNND